MFQFSMRAKVKDNITGLTGTVVGRTEYLDGTHSYCVQPSEVKDGKPVETTWLPSCRLEAAE